jgi:hypothetical protein
VAAIGLQPSGLSEDEPFANMSALVDLPAAIRLPPVGDVPPVLAPRPAVPVEPSQPQPAWVEAHRATTLWSGPDDKGSALTE